MQFDFESRSNISNDLADAIRRMISAGTLAAGSRINEVHLAAELGVSRTPLREALAALVAEDALESRPRKGTFVRPLTHREFQSIYAIRPILDVEALRLSGIPAPDVQRVYFEFLVRYDEAGSGLAIGDLVNALQAEGVHVQRPRYPLLHQQPLFTEGHWAKVARLDATAERPLPTYDPAALPRTTAGNGSLLKLPSFPRATDALLDQYAIAFEKTLGHADALPRTEA